MDLRRQLSGMPGRHHPRQRLGRQQPDEPVPLGRQQRRRPPGARDSRRGPRRRAAARAGARRTLLDSTPGIADARLGRDEGRPELAVRVDRPKAALLGLTVDRRREHDPHERRRHAGGDVPREGQRVSDHRPAARGRTAAGQPTCSDVLVSTARVRCMPAKNLMTRRERDRAGPDRAQEPAAHRHRQRRARDRR